nr:hypothetical protein [Tanacetum cinerariifolium]
MIAMMKLLMMELLILRKIIMMMNTKEANNDDEQEIGEIFRIETNLFNYETPLCAKFNDFNYLLKVDPELFTSGGVPYEIGNHICEPLRFKNRKAKWPTCRSKEDGFYNGGELLGMVRVGYKSNVHDEEAYEYDEKCKDTTYNAPVCKIRRFEIIKYSFEDDEKYVAIKENQYDDLTILSIWHILAHDMAYSAD